ncbi:MAG: hypothetical protein WD941_05870 [Opitutus sp.]
MSVLSRPPGRIRERFLGALIAAVALASAGFAIPIPEGEALYVPTAQRVSAILAAAKRDGWPPQTAGLRAAAAFAYQRDKLQAAEAWFHVHHWAKLLGQKEEEYIPLWIAAVNTARVGHPNMEARYEARPQTLGASLAPELQAWALGNAAFASEFFNLVTPVDYLPRVFEILSELHRKDPAKFKSHPGLALAIAVVYDLPPPPNWPHGQVTPAALPRKLPDPAAAFEWWIRQQQLGRTHHHVGRLGAAELKFVVDAAAPFAELEWSQKAAGMPLGGLAAAYSMIKYRQERVEKNQAIWGGASYRLAEILQHGGICADQAYFATQIGKARGVPTLLFYGAGNDGRHAWFGFLDGDMKWQLDAGRYAEQRFVTGHARDPQTWREFTDHELQFLSERFRELPAYRQSRVHSAFAVEFLAGGDAAAAAVAARKAVNFERRNQDGWATLVAAAQRAGRDAKAVESLLREAALAFQRYPDLEASYVNRVAQSLRSRGQVSEADAEIRRIAVKNQGSRADLSVQQARDIVSRAIETQPLAGQVAAYNKVIDLYGRGAGVVFFDQIVTPFIHHLMALQQQGEALKAVARARSALRVEPGSQLEREFEALAKAARGSGPK